MSFLETLLKGFIRAAVNQVGRDGGKVISNKIYGGKHSTPISVNESNSTPTEQVRITFKKRGDGS